LPSESNNETVTTELVVARSHVSVNVVRFGGAADALVAAATIPRSNAAEATPHNARFMILLLRRASRVRRPGCARTGAGIGDRSGSA
jgi:hypothetical protein